MSQLMVTPSAADLAFVDELVSISMLGTTIVVRPTRRPNALGTQVVTDVVNAATAADSTVVLHRRGAGVDPAVSMGGPTAHGVGHAEPAMVESVGTGLLIVRSESAVWTIDFGSDRFVRSDRPIDQLLLAGSDWTVFDAMWIAPQFVRALTVDGSYLTGRRKLRHPGQQDVRNDRRVPLSLSRIA